MDDLSNIQVARMTNDVRALSLNILKKMHELAAIRLHSTRSEFLNALSYDEPKPGHFIIQLDKSANHLEEGYASFNMLPKLAYGPMSRATKDGLGRYVIIPFRHKLTPDNADNQMQSDLAMALQRVNRFKGKDWELSGNSVAFKVKQAEAALKGIKLTQEVNRAAGQEHPYLAGVNRMREYAPNTRKPISSVYTTFRVASTKKPWKFVHPGFVGAKIFASTSIWAEIEFERIVRSYAESK